MKVKGLEETKPKEVLDKKLKEAKRIPKPEV
jgi:hypothetical protein